MNPTETAANQLRLVMKRFLSAHSSAGDRIVLAVSGGPDSIAMAAICAQLQTEFSLDFYPVTINHQLQSESADWAKQTVEVCKSIGLTNAIAINVDVNQNSGNGLEAAAREARYMALQDYTKKVGARAIMLAHTMDDQAETVLMRIARGSSTRSLSGMAHISGELWRPLLDVERKTLHEALNALDIPTITDPHNFNRQFTRVKIRLDVIPKLIEALGQNVVPGLARTARMARLDTEALESIAASIYPKCIVENELLIGELLSHPLAIQSRIVHHWLMNKGVAPTSLSSDHIFAICRMAKDPQVKGPIKVTGGVEVQKASGRLRT